MGGREWTVPPLTLGELRRLMPKVRELSEIGAQMGETQIGVLVEIVAAALQRNYPDITAETVENLLDLGNAGLVLNAVLTGSGLKSRVPLPGKPWPPARARGRRLRSRRQLGTYLRSPRHRLRIQLSGDRRNDAVRCRGADPVLDRPPAAAPDDCCLSWHWEGKGQACERVARARWKQINLGRRDRAHSRRIRSGLWERRRACRIEPSRAQFQRVAAKDYGDG